MKWLVCVLVLAGCAANGLALSQDSSLKLVNPSNGGTVTMPFTVQMQVRDAGLQQRLASGQDQLAVFFDRSPMRAGETFAAVADKQCRQTPGCPNPSWLSARYIFTTSRSSLEVQDLLDTRTSHQRTDQHFVVVVIIDATGRRVGEAAYQAEFDVNRAPAIP